MHYAVPNLSIICNFNKTGSISKSIGEVLGFSAQNPNIDFDAKSFMYYFRFQTSTVCDCVHVARMTFIQTDVQLKNWIFAIFGILVLFDLQNSLVL